MVETSKQNIKSVGDEFTIKVTYTAIGFDFTPEGLISDMMMMIMGSGDDDCMMRASSVLLLPHHDGDDEKL